MVLCFNFTWFSSFFQFVCVFGWKINMYKQFGTSRCASVVCDQCFMCINMYFCILFKWMNRDHMHTTVQVQYGMALSEIDFLIYVIILPNLENSWIEHITVPARSATTTKLLHWRYARFSFNYSGILKRKKQIILTHSKKGLRFEHNASLMFLRFGSNVIVTFYSAVVSPMIM